MFTRTFLIPKNFCLYEQVAEGQSRSADALAGEKKLETPEQQAEKIVQEKEATRKEEEQKINTAKVLFEDSRQKLIEQAQRLEIIGNERVESLMNDKKFFPGKTPEQRKEIAQKIVNDYINFSLDEYKELQGHLAHLSPEEQARILGIRENVQFNVFVEREKKKVYRVARENRYLDSLPESERDSFRDDIATFSASYSYRDIYDRIKQASEEAGETIDEKTLRNKVSREITLQFIAYAEQKNIPIDAIALLGSEEFSPENDEEGAPMVEYASGNLLSVMSDYSEEAKVMAIKNERYQEEIAKYESTQERETSEDTITEVPKSVSALQSGESMTFISTGSSKDTLYYVESEGDGQYTVSFGTIRMRDVPKKELDVIVSLNKIPVIDRIFNVNNVRNGTLYRQLVKDFVRDTSRDPKENPPYILIAYIYRRFNDVYKMKNTDMGNEDLLGINISHLPIEDQGKRIADVLMTNITLRQGVWKKLQDIKVINTDSRLNLSEFPK